MIAVTGVGQVEVAWVSLRVAGYSLFGFMIYTDADRALVDYMKDGIIEIDFLVGDRCAVFAIESPSEKWIFHSRKQGSIRPEYKIWWEMFGDEFLKGYAGEENRQERKSFLSHLFSFFGNISINNVQNSTIVVGSDNTVTLKQITNPNYGNIYDRNEAFEVIKHFNLENGDVPCLVFFRDWKGNVIHKSPLGDLDSQDKLKKFFREFVDSRDFRNLLQQHTN